MDSGIVLQLFLGVLWALGCLLFITFLLEFREDMLAHPSYPRVGSADKAAHSPVARSIPDLPHLTRR